MVFPKAPAQGIIQHYHPEECVGVTCAKSFLWNNALSKHVGDHDTLLATTDKVVHWQSSVYIAKALAAAHAAEAPTYQFMLVVRC